jgi:hypothetical protein
VQERQKQNVANIQIFEFKFICMCRSDFVEKDNITMPRTRYNQGDDVDE